MKKGVVTILLIICHMLPAQDVIREHLVLNTNKNVFITGENLLFGTDVLLENGKHSSISTVAYLDLIDPEGKSVLRQKIFLNKGMGKGEMYIPSTLKTGNYLLVAYTRWMRNFSFDQFARTRITVFNPFRPILSDSSSDKPVLNLFPESGTVIRGHSNRMVYSLETPDSVNITEVKILDAQGEEVFSKMVSSTSGEFNWNPETNQEYRAVLLDEDQNIFFSPIDLNFSEYHLSVEEQSNAFSITPFLDQNATLKVNGVKIKNPVNAQPISLEKSSLHIGINEASIWSNGKMLCQRLFFIEPEQVRIDLIVPSVAPRQSVQLTVDKLEENAKVSVSVRKKQSYGELAVAFENQYLKSHGLILPKGWREAGKLDHCLIRMSQSTMAVKDAYLLPEIRGPIVSGKLSASDTIDVSGATVYLNSSGKNEIHSAITDSEGRFKFVNTKIGSQSTLSISSEAITNGAEIEVDSGFEESPLTPSNERLVIEEKWLDEIQEHSVQVQLENAYFEFKVDSILPFETRSIFYKEPTKTYVISDYTQFPTLREVIREYVTEVSVRGKEGNERISTSFQGTPLENSDSTLLLLNGLPIYESTSLLNLNPGLLERIEIVFKSYVFGSVNAVGIINFITHDPLYDSQFRSPSIYHLDYTGLEEDKIPYLPDYSSSEEKESRLPDLRRQLFWEPHMTLEKGVDERIDFYSSDITGEFEIIISGSTDSGKIIFETKTFTVQ